MIEEDREISEETLSEAKEKDSYNEALQNESIWWQGMHRVVGEVFVWMGKDEIFLDSLRDFEARYQQGWNDGGGDLAKVHVYEGPGQPHIGPIMDVMMQDKQKSQSQLDIEAWFKELLG